jgi:hypothetical protein
MNQLELIVDAIRKFLLRNKVKILFGTPCFGGMLHNGYFQSMLELSSNFTRIGIPFEVITIGNESLIQRARNGIVAKFMADNTATHLMFIDADITFSWISIVKLLLGNKELSGGCYPKKCFNWDKIKHHNQKNPNLREDELMAKSLDYVFNPIYHQQGTNVVIRLENGMAQVKDIGTGFMMIQKSVISKMIAKYPETKYKNNVAGYGHGNMNEYFYSLFDCCIDSVSRVYLSEDYLFCKRWIDIGGELWLDVNTNLNHTGIIDYKGCLGLIIGEVDVLNKDAQILRKQNQQSINTTLQSPIEHSATSTQSTTPEQSSSQAITQSKRKKKNKNKNKTSNNAVENAMRENTNVDCKDEIDNGSESKFEKIPETEKQEEIINQASMCKHC